MSKRNWEVFKRRVRDERTFADIAREFNISKGRVAQICEQMYRFLENFGTDGTVRLKCRGKMGEKL